MAGTELVRLAPDAPPDKIIAAVNSLLDMMLGNQGVRALMKGHDGISRDVQTGATLASNLFSLVVQNSGANHAQIRNAADNADVLTVTDTALSVAPLGSFNGGINTTTLAAATNITSPAATITTLNATTANATTVNATDVTASGTLTVAGRLQGKLALRANASGTLAPITTVQADVPGCAISLTPGHWEVDCSFDLFINGVGDINQVFQCYIVTVGGTATIVSPLSTVNSSPVQPFRSTISRRWLVQVTATTTVKMVALKGAGAGTSSIEAFSHIQATNA